MQGKETLDLVEELLASALTKLLRVHLPAIGGKDWWNICVVNALKGELQRSAALYGDGALDRLDLTSLVYVTCSNWKSLAAILGTRAEVSSYLHEIRQFRNTVRHDRGADFSVTELAHLLESAKFALQVIEPGTPGIQEIEQKIVALRSENLQSSGRSMCTCL